jgi:magnesium transporter
MPNQKREKAIQLILGMLKEGRRKEALVLLSSLLPADKAALFEDLDSQRQSTFLSEVSTSDAADILEELSDDDAAALAETLDPDLLTRVLDEMEPDEAADLLGDIEPELRQSTLAQLEDADEIRSLMRYPDDSAGGLMTSGYYVFDENTPVGDVFREIQRMEPFDEEIPYVYAVDGQGFLTGIARLADLIRAHPEQPLKAIAITQIVSVHAEEDQEVAARLINRYDLMALPVLDRAGRLLGVITADDAMAVLEEESTEDIYKSAGILGSGGEQAAKSQMLVRGPIWRAWRVRVPFLLITLVGSLAAGAVIGVFEESLEAVVALAFFIPVVMDMGGNSGAQSTSIFIRGQVLGQIDTKEFGKHLLRELGVGLGMGLMIGILAGFIAYLWQGIPELGLVVGLSLAFTMALGASMGFLVPYILISMKVDAAAGSEPFITTIKDITGLLIYFGFAALFMHHLM